MELIKLGSRRTYGDLPWIMCYPDPARPYEGFRTRAVPIMLDYPLLDDDLRILLARCTAVDVENMPSLAELLEITTKAVREKTARSYEGRFYAKHETDEAIQAKLQLLVFNANSSPDRAP